MPGGRNCTASGWPLTWENENTEGDKKEDILLIVKYKNGENPGQKKGEDNLGTVQKGTDLGGT